MTKHPSFNELSPTLNNNQARVLSSELFANRIDQDNHGQVTNESYRHYTLCFCNAQEMCIGEVFKDDQRLAYCEALDIDSAQQYCRQIVDQLLIKQSIINSHNSPHITRLSEAMCAIQNQLDAHCLNLLKIHLKNGNQATTINQLKTQANFHSTTAVFLSYAQWSRLLCDALAYSPPRPISGKDPYLSYVIQSEEADLSATSTLSISLRPNIYKALTCLHTL